MRVCRKKTALQVAQITRGRQLSAGYFGLAPDYFAIPRKQRHEIMEADPSARPLIRWILLSVQIIETMPPLS